jgi:hypothetical protein
MVDRGGIGPISLDGDYAEVVMCDETLSNGAPRAIELGGAVRGLAEADGAGTRDKGVESGTKIG